MKRPSVIAIFAAGVVLGVVLSAVGFHRLRSSTEAHGKSADKLVASRDPVPAAAATPAEAAADRRPEKQIRIDPAMMQNLGVRTALIEPRLITQSIRTTGYVDYDQRLVSQVNARVSGWIEKLYVAYAGQAVRRGETLLNLYSPELVLTQEDYLRANQLAAAEGEGQAGNQTRSDGLDLMSSAATRLRLWGIASSELRKLAKRGTPSETLPIESTSDGVVTESKVVEGSYVRVGDELYMIADLSRVWVYADIYESELPKVRTGQHAEVSANARPGLRFDGIVTYIYPSVNEQSRTVRVRLEFTNPGLALRPGMYVNVTLLDRASMRTLAVPAEAVLDSGVRKIVIIALGGGRFAPREIKLGTQSEDYFQVIDGLRLGERVVTSAQFLIDSESNLSEALNAMTLSPAPSAAGSSAPPHAQGRR